MDSDGGHKASMPQDRKPKSAVKGLARSGALDKVQVREPPMRLPIKIPSELVQHPCYSDGLALIRKIKEAGYEVYIVGGFVREFVRHVLDPHAVGGWPALHNSNGFDIDIATSADPAEIRSMFRNAHFVGQMFGVSMVDFGDHCFEVATFRKEGSYTDGRRPDAVSKGDLEADAARRDFTVNALYLDPVAEEIIDFYGGVSDAFGKVIRTVGKPELRFGEDKLRIVRMSRFAAVLGFEIDEGVWRVALAMAPEVRVLSRERILIEIKKTPAPAVAGFLVLLHRLGLDRQLWGLSFDDPPIWLGDGLALTAIEDMVSCEERLPASFVLLAAWRFFLSQNAAERRRLIAELVLWPTTAQDRRLVVGLGHLVSLFRDQLGHVTTVQELMPCYQAAWLTALLQLLDKLARLPQEVLAVLLQQLLEDQQACDPFCAVADVRLGANAALVCAARGETAGLRSRIVAEVQQRNLDRRWIAVLESFGRLLDQRLPMATAHFMGEIMAAAFDGTDLDASVLTSIKAVQQALRL
jgi:hypothetical protein